MTTPGLEPYRGQRGESRRCEPARRVGSLVVECSATGNGDGHHHGNRQSARRQQRTDQQTTVGVHELIAPTAGKVGSDEEPRQCRGEQQQTRDTSVAERPHAGGDQRAAGEEIDPGMLQVAATLGEYGQHQKDSE